MHFVWTHIGTWSDQASRYVGTIGSIVRNNTGGCIENCSNSGVQTIQYYIADETVTDFTNILWETYDATNKISLNTTGKYVIYVRITDKAGNATIEGLSIDGADAENYQINVPSEEVSLSSPVTINKASIEVDDHTVVKRYVYTVDTTESIDVKAFLPEDCGGIAVSQPEVSGDFTLTEDGVVFENGTLTYTICKGEIGETGTIKVKLISQNYSTVCVTLDVVLVDNYG